MAFDENLAARVRRIVGSRPDVTERRMFGGLAFLVDGRMFLGIRDASLMARIGTEHHADALAMPHVRPMDFTGRPIKGYAYVDAPAIARAADLEAWVGWCLSHVASLPKNSAS